MISKIYFPKISTVFNFFNLEKNKPKTVIKDFDLHSFQKIFNPKLSTYLDAKIERYKNFSDTKLTTEAIEYAVSLLKNGGKRIRPYITFVAYCTEGGVDQEEALCAGIALELFHTFALIHDDIIDRGLERHGQITTQIHMKEFIKSYPRGDKVHIAESMALLAGDLIFGWSHEVVAHLNNKKVQELFFKMIEEIVAGQMLDVSFMLQYEVDSQSIFQKNKLKTALYSFVNPLLIGSTLAHQDTHNVLYCELGTTLGQAFQIQDDLLDIIGDTQETGKMNFLDIEDGQHTLISQYIYEHADIKDKEVFMSLFGKPLDNHGKKVLIRLFDDTGAIVFAKEQITTLFTQSKTLITQSQLRQETKDVWLNFINLLDKRKS